MSDWSVEVTESAERDLEDAALYIHDTLGSPRAAYSLLDAETHVVRIERMLYARSNWIANVN